MDPPQKDRGKEIRVPAQSYDDERGIVTRASAYTSVSETLERLRRIVREKGLEEFALVQGALGGN